MRVYKLILFIIILIITYPIIYLLIDYIQFKDETVTVNIEMKSNSDEEIRLFTMPINGRAMTAYGDPEKAIYSIIPITKGYNKLQFKIPVDEFPIEQFRLYFGNTEKTIFIKSIEIYYEGFSKTWEKDSLEQFIPFNTIKFSTNLRSDVLVINNAQLGPLTSPDISALSDKILSHKPDNLSYRNIWLLTIYLLITLFIINRMFSVTLNIISLKPILFSLLFAFALIIPFISLLTNINDKYETNEKRVLNPAPRFQAEYLFNLPNHVNNYFNDNFPLRNYFVNAYKTLTAEKLKSTEISSEVHFGKEDWLFWKGSKIMNDVSGSIKLSDNQLERIKYNLEIWYKWCTLNNIDFHIMIIPHKHSVYPEYLNSSFSVKADTLWIDRLIPYINKNSFVEIYDVRKDFQKAKSNYRIYDRTDSHWNQYGGFIGYSKYISEIAKNHPEWDITPFTLNDFKIKLKEGEGGNLAGMLGLESKFKENYVKLVPRFNSKVSSENNKFGFDYKVRVRHSKNNSLPKIVMFTDSFVNRFSEFISHHFSTSIYLRTRIIDYDFILKQKPDVVGMLFSDHNIHQLLQPIPEDIIKQVENYRLK